MAKGKNKKVFKEQEGILPLVGWFIISYWHHRWFGWSPYIAFIPAYAYLVFWGLITIYPLRKKHEENNTRYYRVAALFYLFSGISAITLFLAGLLTLIYKWLSGFVSNIDWSFINIDWVWLQTALIAAVLTPLIMVIIVWGVYFLMPYTKKWMGYDDQDGVPSNPYTPLEDKNLLIQNIIELSGKTSWEDDLEHLDIDALNDIHEKLSRHDNK